MGNRKTKWLEIQEREASRFWEERMNIVAQNGNDGYHYEQEDNYKEAQRPFISKSEQSKHAERKSTPVFSGCLEYFPKAIKYVSKVSKAGNDQHHPDKPLHWDKSKSFDESDALVRHLIDHSINPIDDDGILHAGKVAWRALALLERYLDENPQI